MIRSFANSETERLFQGHTVRRLPVSIQRTALRKLIQLHAAVELAFLRVPPGNCLEALKHDRIGQYSMRINDQWRICFIWHNGDVFNVEIVDYH